MSGVQMVPDGSRASWQSNAAGEQLTVYGTALDVDPAELRALALKIELTREEVAGELETARRANAALGTTCTVAPGSGSHAIGCVWNALTLGGDALAQADALARSLRTAADLYEQAEADSQSAFVWQVPRSLSLTSPALRIGLLLGLSFAEARTHGQWTPGDHQFGYLLNELAWTATGGVYYPDFLPFADDPARRLAFWLAPLTTRYFGTSTQATAHQIQPTIGSSSAAPPTPAPDVSALLTRMYSLYPEQGDVPPGTIRLDRIASPDGEVSWQVYLPGTQSSESGGMVSQLGASGAALTTMAPVLPTPQAFALAGRLATGANGLFNSSNPHDWTTNLQAYAGMETAVQAGVLQALRQAGVGRGEPIMFVGHSQGAMTAMRLANDSDVRQEFTVSSVVTVGGPVGHIPTAEDVATLHIEHEEDLVAGVEHTANPLEYGRTTVVRSMSASDMPADAGVDGVWDSHDLPAYIRTAELIDASQDPAIQEWYRLSEDVWGEDGATSTSFYYQLVRED